MDRIIRDCNPSSTSMIHTTSSPSLRALLGHDYCKCHLPDEGANFVLYGLPRSGFSSTNCLNSLLIVTQLLCSVGTRMFESSTITVHKPITGLWLHSLGIDTNKITGQARSMVRPLSLRNTYRASSFFIT